MSRTAAAGKQKRSKRYTCSNRDCDIWITPQEHDQIIRGLEDPSFGARCPEHPTMKLRKHHHRELVSAGAIDWPNVQKELGARGIEIRGGGADEAPGVYKNLDDVIAAHTNIEVVHRLQPLGVVMAGPDIARDD